LLLKELRRKSEGGVEEDGRGKGERKVGDVDEDCSRRRRKRSACHSHEVLQVEVE
jgi:hypothetical protein